MPAIPQTIFPIALDSDYTLFHTHNSTQSTLSTPLSEFDTEIQVEPQPANDLDVWASNGFVKIEDELIYYDEVEKNENGKVFKLLECIRGVEGTPKKHAIGTPILGTVVAQHHNQLADAIIQIEETIGELADMLERQPRGGFFARQNMVAAPKKVAFQDNGLSLHASLAEMMGCVPVGDDACPDVEFEFNLGFDPENPLNAEFCVRIFGNYTSFEIDFDDGNKTTTQFSGVHTYEMEGTYNPTVTVTSDNCCIVQQATTPNEACEGVALPTPSVPFQVFIPSCPEIPIPIFPETKCPGPLFNLPPILQPELNLCSLAPVSNICSFSIEGVCPSVISVFSPCEISILSFVGCDIPSTISIVGCCDFPSVISCDCDFISFVTISVEFGPFPSVPTIDFGPVPSFDCISFCDIPLFPPISFDPAPSIPPISLEVFLTLSTDCISFCDVPSFGPIGFGPVPSFDCISFCDFPVIPPVSFDPFPSIGPISIEISVCAPSFDCVSFCGVPSFDCISFCDTPSFAPIEFGPAPSFAPIQFGPPPSFDCISFCDNIPSIPPISFDPFPSIGPISIEISVCAPSFDCVSFCDVPSFECISFCDPPTFSPIQFADPPSFAPIQFGPAPTISVDYGTPPVLSCVVQVICPSTPSIPSCPTVNFAAAPNFRFAREEPRGFHDTEFGEDIPVTLGELGIPEEIKIIAPDIPDINVKHNIPTEISIKPIEIRDIRILNVEKIPTEIKVTGVSDIPTKIDFVGNIPSRIFVEPSPALPSVFILEARGIPNTISVTGIPRSIEIKHDIPKTIQLLMPDNPVVEMQYKGAPIDINVNLNIEKALSEIIIVKP